MSHGACFTLHAGRFFEPTPVVDQVLGDLPHVWLDLVLRLDLAEMNDRTREPGLKREVQESGVENLAGCWLESETDVAHAQSCVDQRMATPKFADRFDSGDSGFAKLLVS